MTLLTHFTLCHRFLSSEFERSDHQHLLWSILYFTSHSLQMLSLLLSPQMLPDLLRIPSILFLFLTLSMCSFLYFSHLAVTHSDSCSTTALRFAPFKSALPQIVGIFVNSFCLMLNIGDPYNEACAHPSMPVMRKIRFPLILVQFVNFPMLLESTVFANCKLPVPMPSQAVNGNQEGCVNGSVLYTWFTGMATTLSKIAIKCRELWWSPVPQTN